MAEYIDRDELLNELCADCKGFSHKPCPNLTGRCAEYEFVRDFEAADVAPVRHGEWVGTADGYADGELVYDIWNCSCCGYDADGADEKPDWKYCPHCGAKMDGGDTE